MSNFNKDLPQFGLEHPVCKHKSFSNLFVKSVEVEASIILLFWNAALCAHSHAREEHSKLRVFPVPVGDSKTPFCFCPEIKIQVSQECDELMHSSHNLVRTVVKILTFCKHSMTFDM